jgi:hypothetical protein
MSSGGWVSAGRPPVRASIWAAFVWRWSASCDLDGRLVVRKEGPVLVRRGSSARRTHFRSGVGRSGRISSRERSRAGTVGQGVIIGKYGVMAEDGSAHPPVRSDPDNVTRLIDHRRAAQRSSAEVSGPCCAPGSFVGVRRYHPMPARSGLEYCWSSASASPSGASAEAARESRLSPRPDQTCHSGSCTCAQYMLSPG